MSHPRRTVALALQSHVALYCIENASRGTDTPNTQVKYDPLSVGTIDCDIVDVNIYFFLGSHLLALARASFKT